MRLTVRAFLLTVGLALGVREGGNPNSDNLALELSTEVVMTNAGPVIQPALVPVRARSARPICAVPSVIFRANTTQNEMIAAVVNRAAECALQEAVAKR
jgi:hypothetical protein